MNGVPKEVVGVGEALQKQAEHVTDGHHSRLRQRLVPQRQQQFGDQLKLPQELSVFSSFAGIRRQEANDMKLHSSTNLNTKNRVRIRFYWTKSGEKQDYLVKERAVLSRVKTHLDSVRSSMKCSNRDRCSSYGACSQTCRGKKWTPLSGSIKYLHQPIYNQQSYSCSSRFHFQGKETD